MSLHSSMTPEWLEIVAIVALAASFLSALFIAGDILAGHRQKMWVMNLVWPITALYFGPLGLWAYWVMGRAQSKAHEHAMDFAQEHDEGHQNSKKPFWQTVFVATSHCGAGCTLGDTIGETAIFLTGFTLLGSELLTACIVDFALAYLVGIAFQYFTIAPMRELSPGEGLRAAIKADTISLVAFEVGMFGVMALNRMALGVGHPEPNTPTYWFLMQIAMIAGFATSYPANWALVRLKWKEAM